MFLNQHGVLIFNKMAYLCSGNKNNTIMARNKIDKRNVILREKKRANGGCSFYLDMYNPDGGDNNHKHSYKFLKLYTEPERGSVEKRADIRRRNREIRNLAEAARKKMEDDLNCGRLGIVNVNKSKNLLLVDWLKALAEKKAESGQSKSNATTINNVILHIEKSGQGKKYLLDVDKAFCQKFLLYLASAKTIGTDKPKWCEHHEKPMAKSTAQLYYNTFVTALNEAVRDNYLSVNPAAKLGKEDKKPIRGENETRGFLEQNEVLKLIETPCKDETVKRAFLFACFCGLRVSDVRSLVWGDIETREDGQYIAKEMVKTRQVVRIPLSDAALKWIPDRNDAKDADLVFDLPNYFSINYIIKQWAKSAGIDKRVSFHLARHTFATSLLTKGADIYTTSKLLGHQNLRTTQIYADVVDAKKKSAVNLLNSMLEG